jgi:hypothetical protein
MTRVNNDLGNPGYGAIGIWVEAYETANNGTSSTIHVRGGYYNNSPYNIYADTAYVSLNGRGNVSFTTGYPGDHVTDEFDVEVAHNGDGSAVSASYSCYGHSTYPSNDVNPTVTISTSANPRHTVHYDANGGTGAPSDSTKIYGFHWYVSTTVPSREGYTFQYWHGSDGNNYSPGQEWTGDFDFTLTAVWKINTWQVSFNANGGTNAPGNQTKTYGQTLTLSSAVPTRTLYDFVSWAGSDGNTYYPNSQFTGNYGLTLTANWKLAYIAPTVSSLQAYHCDSAGVASDSGKYIHVIVDWSVDRTISSTNQGSGIKISCNGADYTIGISGQSGKTEYTFGAGGLDYDTTYAVTALVYDTYMGINYGTSKTINAQGAKYAMDIAPNGHVCFGGSASDDYHICVKENGTIIWHN